MTSLRRCVRGVVYAEFIIAFFPMFFFFLCTVQLAWLAQAVLVVRHAAVLAARKAVVVLDDDPARYEAEPRQLLQVKERSTTTQLGLTLLSLLAGDDAPQSNEGSKNADKVQGGARLDAIRSTAYMPLSVLAPSLEHQFQMLQNVGRADGSGESVAQSIGGRPWLRILAGFGMYVRYASALTFPRAPRATELRDPAQVFATHEPITTRITFLFPCTIPIARAIICRTFLDQLGLAQAQAQLAGLNDARSLDDVRARVAAARDSVGQGAEDLQRLMIELEQSELPQVALAYGLLTGERFAVLRAEATLPNQGAPYRYASELETDDTKENP